MDEKKLHTLEFQLKGIDGNMRCKLLQKRSTEKQQECSRTYCHRKIYFSELNRSIFQISLKYIKLVIPKILFILVLVLCNFNVYFKIPPVTKIKISDVWLSPSKDFSEVFTPPPSSASWRVVVVGCACPVWGLVRTLFVFFYLMFLNIYYWEKLTFSKLYGKVNFSKRKSEIH